jgi:hypothetical protein
MRTLPELIRAILNGYEAGIPEAVARDCRRGRLPGQVWEDRASPETTEWLAKHYPNEVWRPVQLIWSQAEPKPPKLPPPTQQGAVLLTLGVDGRTTMRFVETEVPARRTSQTMTARAMAVQLGCTGDHEKCQALKYFARRYCEENGLTVTSNTDIKQHEQFPIDAALWAMEQVERAK